MGRRRDYTLTLAERYESHVDRTAGPDACHPWTANRSHQGYGRIVVGSRTDHSVRTCEAHRVGWELANGPIPAGLCVLHRCDNPPCQNQRHWFLGTRAENNADKDAKGRARKVRGEAATHARLDEEKVREIRAAHARGAGLRPLGRQYGVTHRAIHMIVHRKSWAHVE